MTALDCSILWACALLAAWASAPVPAVAARGAAAKSRM